MEAKHFLFGIVILLTVGTFSSSYARIDPNSVVAIYLFDNDEDDILIDAWEDGHDAEIFGKPEWVEGKYGQGLRLDGTAYADVGQDHAEAFSLKTFTVAAWIGDKEISGHQYVLCKSTGSADRNYTMNIRDATGVLVSGSSKDGTWRAVISKTCVADGEWHHLAATYDGEKFRIYVDGVLETDQALAGPPATNNAPLRIGGGPGQLYRFEGIIDEILIANVALGEADIKTIVNEGLERATGIAAVSPAGKFTSTWASIKAQS